MKIAICGSVTFMHEIRDLQKKLLIMGFKEVYIPRGFDAEQEDAELKDKLTVEEDAQRKVEFDLIRRHFYAILKSDCVLVANYDKKGTKGYVGGNTLIEMGYAFAFGKPIFLLNEVGEMAYSAEIGGMEPIFIENNLENIRKYYNFG